MVILGEKLEARRSAVLGLCLGVPRVCFVISRSWPGRKVAHALSPSMRGERPSHLSSILATFKVSKNTLARTSSKKNLVLKVTWSYKGGEREASNERKVP